MRAGIESSAFVTQSSPPPPSAIGLGGSPSASRFARPEPIQKSSPKTFSVAGIASSSCESTWIALFIAVTLLAAVMLLAVPTCSARKRNCRLRFETSMRSPSVTVIMPPGAVATPSSAKFLRNSQPSAPQPTMNVLDACSFACVAAPKSAMFAS